MSRGPDTNVSVQSAGGDSATSRRITRCWRVLPSDDSGSMNRESRSASTHSYTALRSALRTSVALIPAELSCLGISTELIPSMYPFYCLLPFP